MTGIWGFARSVLWLVVALGVGVNLSACGGISGANSANFSANSAGATKSRKLIIKENPANDIVEHLRIVEKRKAIHEITRDDMYRVPTGTTFGRKNWSASSPNIEAIELMIKHKDDIIVALREVGYNQAQITGAYQGAFYEYGRTCELALNGANTCQAV